MTQIHFLKTLFDDIKVASLAPTGKFALRRILEHVTTEHRFIVEYGAGDGVITKELLRCLPPDGKLVAIELNRDFIQELKAIDDARLTVVEGDVVTHAKMLGSLGLPQIDLVVSGIPFSLLKQKERREIIEYTHRHLAQGGIFLIYQFTLLIFPILKKIFSKTEWHFELRNLPPYFIMTARK